MGLEMKLLLNVRQISPLHWPVYHSSFSITSKYCYFCNKGSSYEWTWIICHSLLCL